MRIQKSVIGVSSNVSIPVKQGPQTFTNFYLIFAHPATQMSYFNFKGCRYEFENGDVETDQVLNTEIELHSSETITIEFGSEQEFALAFEIIL